MHIVSYGPVGLEVISTILDMMIIDTKETFPLPTEFFVRRVLIPEVAIRLIAEDLNRSINDPDVQKTLEDSRAYGVALFSELEPLGKVVPPKVSERPSRSSVKKTKESRYLAQVPDQMVPYLGRLFNPPADGACGYHVIAAATGIEGTESHLEVRRMLLEEFTTHREAHEEFLAVSAARAKPRRVVDRSRLVGVAAVDDAIERLKCDSSASSSDSWLSMPTMGYAIASAFEQPVIFLVKEQALCWSFFPYRIDFKGSKPIVLSFVDNNHFVGYELQTGLSPFPPPFRKGWTTCSSQYITRWKAEHTQSWTLWQDLHAPAS